MPRSLAAPSGRSIGTSLGILAVATFALAGCQVSDGEQHTDPQAFTWTGDIKAPGTMNIRNLNGAIEVRPSTDAQVHITAATTWRRGDPKKDVQYNVVTEGNDITVCAIWGRGTCSANDYKSKANFRLFGSKGDVSVKFTVLVPTGVKVNAITINGSVDALATAPVFAHTTNGGVKVGTAVGPVDAETVNGSVDARMTTLGEGGAARAVTVNGSASLYIPDNAAGSVELSNVNGSLGSDFALAGSSKHEMNGTLGAGGRSIEVKTVNGSAYLRRINADGTVGAPTGAATVPKP